MPFPTVPLAAIALPKWGTKSKSRPGSTQTTLRPLETLDEKDTFGLPSPDDPDPFGVLALEKAGLEIREAGTKSRPTSDAFEYRPSPTSPIFANFARHSMQSIDSVSRHDSKRDSKRSTISVDQGTQTADLPGVETVEEAEIPGGSESPVKKATEDLAWISDEEARERFEEEPEVYVEERAPTVQILAQSVPAQSIASPRVTRAKLVTIPKRIPPALPPRSPYRMKVDRAIHEEMDKDDGPDEEADYQPSSHYSSPTRSTFDNEVAPPNPWEDVDLRAPGSPQTETSATNPRSLSTDDGKESGGSPHTEYSAVLQPTIIDDDTREKEESEPKEATHGQEEQYVHPSGIPLGSIAIEPTSESKDLAIIHQASPINTDAPVPDGEKPAVDAEEFHSVPSTPIEAPSQATKEIEARIETPVGLGIS